MRAIRPGTAPVVALILAAALAACGSGDDDDRGSGSQTSSVSTAMSVVPPPTAPVTTAATTTVAETVPPSTTSPATTSTTAAPPQFTFSATEISAELATRMEPTSWRPGCPVDLAELRYLQLAYWGFDNAVHTGELVVHQDAVDVMQEVFAMLFTERFPIRSMRLVDDFGGDDFQSIEADNTSAFNCRASTGSTNWSQHAYGRAIDINPIENPYISDGQTEHEASIPYLDRSDVRPGMIVEGGAVVAAFDSHGWGWGGRWNDPQDWQHFSANGR